jgi:hypothetical protein
MTRQVRTVPLNLGIFLLSYPLLATTRHYSPLFHQLNIIFFSCFASFPPPLTLFIPLLPVDVALVPWPRLTRGHPERNSGRGNIRSSHYTIGSDSLDREMSPSHLSALLNFLRSAFSLFLSLFSPSCMSLLLFSIFMVQIALRKIDLKLVVHFLYFLGSYLLD